MKKHIVLWCLLCGWTLVAEMVSADFSVWLVRKVPEVSETIKQARTEIRSSLLERFFDHRTEMFYDVLW